MITIIITSPEAKESATSMKIPWVQSFLKGSIICVLSSWFQDGFVVFYIVIIIVISYDF